MKRCIDLNCDLGEDPALRGTDLALLEVVSAASIACGGHAGDSESMRFIAEAAAASGVAIGAHPSYPDRDGFGRTEMALSAVEIQRTVTQQVAALRNIVADRGARIRHVKPHGALYHAAMTRREVADAVAAGVAAVDRQLMLVGLAGARGLVWWRDAGMRVVSEAFADRRYEPDGSLRSRTKPNSLIEEPSAAAEQAVRIAQGRGVVAADGSVVAVEAETICVHGDTPGAVVIAAAVKKALGDAGINVCRVE